MSFRFSRTSKTPRAELERARAVMRELGVKGMKLEELLRAPPSDKPRTGAQR